MNADILPGPVNATTTPVDATNFLTIAKHFPNATLSIGWTTNYGANFPTSSYTNEQIEQMLQTIQKNNVTQTITFPMRAGIVAEGLENVKLLLGNVSGSTLTIWSSQGDKVNVTNLRGLIKNVGLDKVYVDVPEDLEKELRLDTLASACCGQFSFLSVFAIVFAVFGTVLI